MWTIINPAQNEQIDIIYHRPTTPPTAEGQSIHRSLSLVQQWWSERRGEGWGTLKVSDQGGGMLRSICKYSLKDQVESDHIDFFRTQIILRWPERKSRDRI